MQCNKSLCVDQGTYRWAPMLRTERIWLKRVRCLSLTFLGPYLIVRQKGELSSGAPRLIKAIPKVRLPRESRLLSRTWRKNMDLRRVVDKPWYIKTAGYCSAGTKSKKSHTCHEHHFKEWCWMQREAKDYGIYSPVNIPFWKRENKENRRKITGCQGLLRAIESWP